MDHVHRRGSVIHPSRRRLSPSRFTHALEVLESRITPSSIVTLSAGSLHVVGDAGGAGEDENLIFTVSGGALRIADPGHSIVAGAGTVQDGAHAVLASLASFTSLHLFTGVGHDRVDIEGPLPALQEFSVRADDPSSLISIHGSITVHDTTGNGGRHELAAGSIENLGALSASGLAGGQIVLRGASVLNSGSLIADGSAGSGGAVSIDFTKILEQTDSGAISARGGAHGHGGTVALQTVSDEANAFLSGSIDATGPGIGQTGGTIVVTAGHVALTGVRLDASGNSGGGAILVGGDFQGGGTLAHAQFVTVDADSQLAADAVLAGRGGKVVVWSDKMTAFAGQVSARGGSASGNGGSLEVSGRELLVFQGLGDASAPHGQAGSLLLDPKNLTVDAAAPLGAAITNVDFASQTGVSISLNPDALTATLNTGTAVKLQASNDLTVNSAITANNASGAGGALTLQAGRSLLLNATIITDDGALTLVANETAANGVVDADRDPGAAVITMASGVALNAGAGAVNITLGNGAGLTNSTSGDLTLRAIAGGAVTVMNQGPTANTDVNLLGAITASGPIMIAADALTINTTTGSLIAGLNTVTLAPLTAGRAIDLGTKTAGTLGLSGLELNNRIVAGLLQIGDSSSGAITVSASLTPGYHLSLTTGAGLTFKQPVTLAANKSLTVTALGTTNGAVSLPNTTSDLSTSGTGAISVTTARNIMLATGATITTVNGNLTLSANQQATPTSGTFDGVYLNLSGVLIRAAGTGGVLVSGRGGADPAGAGGYGVLVGNGAQILGGTAGSVVVQGTGGTGNGNGGVEVVGTASINSGGANVQVTGFGQGATNLSANPGVSVISGAMISAGGSGTVTVQGTGGISSTNNHGVSLSGAGAVITSSGGNVQVTGQGGASSAGGNFGVSLSNGATITGGGSATVTVTGTGGLGSFGSTGIGLFSSTITSGGGPVLATGFVGTVGSGIQVGNLGVFTTAANGGNLTLAGDSMSLFTNGTVATSALGTLTLRPTTAGTLINVGGADSAGTLGLDPSELAIISTGTLQIGDNSSGALTVSAALSPSFNLSLTSSAGIVFNQAVTMAMNKSLSATASGTAAGSISLPNSTSSLMTFGSGAVTLTAARNISLAAGSSILAISGDVTLSANQQATPAAGGFAGIGLTSAVVQSGGNVSLSGKGGDSAGGNEFGVQISSSTVKGGVSGSVLVQGTGGPSAGSSNHGVFLSGSTPAITSTGANVSVTGQGGGAGASGSNFGVYVTAGQITAGGSGTVTVQGTGGTGTNGANQGVELTGVAGTVGTITSGGGAVKITAVGGPGTSSGLVSGVSGASFGTITTAANGGSLTLLVSSYLLTSSSVISTPAAGSITLAPAIPGTAIALGGTIVGALSVLNSDLGFFATGTLQIGDANSGAINMAGVLTPALNLSLTTGAGVSFGQGITMAVNKSLTVTALGTASTGAITLPSATADLVASGSGAITLTAARNISLVAGASITTVDGALTLSANQQTTPTSGNFFGVYLNGAALVQTTGTGNLSVMGRGGDNSSYVEDGVSLYNGGVIRGGTAGSVNVQGTSGAVPTAAGVYLYNPGSLISSSGANVQVTGQSFGTSLVGSAGVGVYNGAQIAAGGAGTVNVQGTGSVGAGTFNDGVIVSGTGATITSAGGNVQVAGQGRGATGANQNHGVSLVAGGLITAGGSGSVLVQGTGGTFGSSNIGVYLDGTGSKITSGGGNVQVTGLGGAGTGSSNLGVELILGAQIAAGGAGNVIVQGTGAAAGGSAYGLFLSGSMITSGGGSVQVTGTGGGSATSSFANGILLASSGQITAGGSGTVTVQGTGGAGSGGSNEGLSFQGSAGSAPMITSSGGAVQVTGTAGGGTASFGLQLGSAGSPFGTITTAGNGGNLMLIGDSMAFSTSALVSTQAGGTATIRPLTPGTLIDLGGTDAAGTLGLTDAELDTVAAGLLQIGDSSSGAITVSAALTHGNSLSLTTSAGLTFNQSVTMAAGKSLTAVAGSTISLATGSSRLAATGSGGISLTTTRDIALAAGASVTTVDGPLALSANQQAVPTGGSFIGINVLGTGAVVQATGAGNVSLLGKGGNSGLSQYGVQVATGGRVQGGTTGTLLVQGTAGASGSGSGWGVAMGGTGSTITSSGGSVQVIGLGGSTGSSTVNYGVILNAGSQISAGGMGSVTVQGTGALSSGGSNYGVVVSGGGAQITSSGGSVQVTGQGGGTSGSFFNHGISLSVTGTITAGGTGTVTLQGTGGGGALSYGVDLESSAATPAQITSGGGAVQVTASAGPSTAVGLHVGEPTFASFGIITTAANGGSLTLISDGMAFTSDAVISGPANGTITLRTKTVGNLINLGGSDSAGTLALTATELGVISTGTLQIGDSTSGALTVSAALTPAWHLSLTSGSSIVFGQSLTMAVNKNLTASAPGAANGTISLSSSSSKLAASGTGAISLTAARGITLGSGAAITIVDGNLTLSANQQATPSTGNITGISLTNAVIQATGSGNVSLYGKGGDGSPSQLGVSLTGSRVQGGSAGVVTVQGTGGPSTVFNNYGVFLSGATSSISSSGASIVVTGQAGGTGSSGTNPGVYLAGGQVIGTGAGSVTVQGTGGGGSGSFQTGVRVSGSTAQISSGDGDLQVLGQGRGTGSTFSNYGVTLDTGATILATGAGNVLVQGTGGGGSNAINDGVYVTGATITSSGGSVQVIGTGGSAGSDSGVNVGSGGLITAGGSGNVTVQGTGGAVGSGNTGVTINGTITALSGNVQVTGQGGGAGTGGLNSGVVVSSGVITTGSSAATVTVQGTGGGGTGGNNDGIDLIGSASTPGTITSMGGAVKVIGVAGTSGAGGSNGLVGGFIGASFGTVATATYGGSLTLLVDSFSFSPDTAIKTQSTGTVTLAPATAGTAITLGGKAFGTLGLLNSDFNFFSTGTLQLGDTRSGVINTVNSVAPPVNLSLVTGAGITLNQGITMAAGKSLTANAGGTISLRSASLTATGAGGISLTTARDLTISLGASITTVDGNLTLAANQQAAPSSGNFFGITVSSATVQVTGAGSLSLAGRGGDNATAGEEGVQLIGGKVIGGTGNVTVQGTGGATNQNSNFGVLVTTAGSVITSNGGNVRVIGQAGGTGASLANNGVNLVSGGQISAGGLGTVTVQGTGGASAGVSNWGVALFGTGTAITSAGGNVQVAGAGGGSGGAATNYGVCVQSGAIITSGAGGTVSVAGTGGAGTGGKNHGVEVVGTSTAPGTISSGGGAILVSGVAGEGIGSVGLNLGDLIPFGVISTAVNGGDVTLLADSITLTGGSATKTQSTGTLTIKPLTPGTTISLGGADAAGTLGLSSSELGTISTGNLQIGDSTSGAILANTALSAFPDIALTNGSGGISFGASGSLVTAAGTVSLNAGAGGVVSTSGSGVKITANRLSIVAGGGIGRAAAPLGVSATVLETDSSGGNGDQFLRGNATVGPAGLQAGTGGLNFFDGTFTLGGSDRLGDGSKLTLNNAALVLGVFNETVAGVTLLSGALSGNGGTLSSASDFEIQSGTVSANLAGNVGLAKTTTGTAILSGANSYRGTTVVAAGILNVQNALALGTTDGGTAVGDGASLQIQGGISFGEAITLSGLGAVGSSGALEAVSEQNTLTGPVTLAGATKISVDADAGLAVSGTIADSTVGSSDLALAIASGGTAALTGGVGAAVPLKSLTTTGPGPLSLGGNVTTTGTQSYGGEVAIVAAGNFSTTNSAVSFGGATTLHANLTVNAGTGDVTFTGVIDGAAALVANSSGSTVFGAAVGNAVALTSLLTDSGGATTLASSVTTAGTQSYGDAVILTGHAKLATGNANITFGSTIDGALPNAQSLTLLAGTGALMFGGAIGGAVPLASLTAISGPAALALPAITLGGDLSVTTANGVITQTGPHKVAGTATYHAGLADIELSQTGNDFTGPVSFLSQAGPVTITTASALTLEASSVSGTFKATASGGDLNVAGAIDFTGDLSLVAAGPESALIVSSDLRKSGPSAAEIHLNATGDIVFRNSASLDETAGLANIELDADSDQSRSGAILIEAGSAIDSHGGNLTLGGGVAAVKQVAWGSGSVYDGLTLGAGVAIRGAIRSGGGFVRVNGHGMSDPASVSGQNYGVGIEGAGEVTSTGANGITIIATGGTRSAAFSMSSLGGMGTPRLGDGGSETFTGQIYLDLQSADPFTDSITLEGAAIHSKGSLQFRAHDSGDSVGVAGAAGTLNLSTAELAQLTPGFQSITFGGGPLAINAASFSDPVYLGGTSIDLRGTVTAGDHPVYLNGALITIEQGATFTVKSTDVIYDTNQVVVAGGTLDLGGFNETVGGVQLASGTIDANGGSLTSATAFQLQSGSVHAALAGTTAAVGVLKSTPGTVSLSAASPYAGGTTIRSGTVEISHPQALGHGPVTLNDAMTGSDSSALLATASLGSFQNDIVVANLGTGKNSIGTTSFTATDGTVFGGTLTLNKAATLESGNGDGTAFTGVISGNAGTLSIEGGARVSLTNAANSFAGAVKISGSGTTLQIEGNGNPLSAVTGVDVSLGSTLAMAAAGLHGVFLKSLTGAGTVTSALPGTPQELSIDIETGAANFAGTITDGASPVSFFKTGPGVQTLSGLNSFSGTTTVDQGKLALVNSASNNNLAASAEITVSGGATLDVTGLHLGAVHGILLAGGQSLQGAGTVAGKIKAPAASTISPGLDAQPGTLSTGDVAFTAGSIFAAQIESPATGHDVLKVTGTVSLGDATLSLAGHVGSSPYQQIVLVQNDGTDAVSGTFHGLPEGSIVPLNGVNFILSYHGGDGNDVTLEQGRSILAVASVGAPVVYVYNAITGNQIFAINAYETKYRDSLRVAVADMNGDGYDDIIVTTAKGTGRLRVFDGLTGQQFTSGPFAGEFAVFNGKTDRGAFVAAGDLTGDGRADIIVGSALGGSKVRVFDGVTGSALTFAGNNTFFQPFGKTFRGGVRVAAGDVNGNGVSDLVVGEGYYGAQVQVYEGAILFTQSGTTPVPAPSPLLSFSYGAKNYRGGVNIATGDFDGDGLADLIVGANAGRPSAVQVYSGILQDARRLPHEISSAILPFDKNPLRPAYALGVRVASFDFDGDGIADIIAASGGGTGKSAVNIYSGADHSLLRTLAAFPSLPKIALFIAASATR